MNSHHPLRRKDRAIGEEEAYCLLAEAEYGVLATVDAQGQPYGVPLNFCVTEGAIYFHCAKSGHKIDNIRANPKASFTVVGKTRVLPADFGTLYESAIAFGELFEVHDKEKQQGLEGLLLKYSHNFLQEGRQYIDAMAAKTRVFKLSLQTLSGKSRK